MTAVLDLKLSYARAWLVTASVTKLHHSPSAKFLRRVVLARRPPTCAPRYPSSLEACVKYWPSPLLPLRNAIRLRPGARPRRASVLSKRDCVKALRRLPSSSAGEYRSPLRHFCPFPDRALCRYLSSGYRRRHLRSVSPVRALVSMLAC